MPYNIPEVGSIVFTDIQQIRDHKFVGSHAFDHAAFVAVDCFAADPTRPISERAEALKIMEIRGMGFTEEELAEDGFTDQEIVDLHMSHFVKDDDGED